MWPDVHDSLPAVLFLAYKYAEPDQVRAALLANTNVGGNTVHRGAILGAILGAAHGSGAGFGGDGGTSSVLLDGLHDQKTIASEVDQFLDGILAIARDRNRKGSGKPAGNNGGTDSSDSKSEL